MKGKLLTFVAVFWLLDIVDGSYSSILSSGEEECFRVQTPRNSPVMISGNFDLIDDMSSDPIVARFESDTTVLWSSTPGDPEGTFDLEVHDGGLHRFCLENGKHEMADGLDRTIGWAVRVRTLARSLGEGEEGPDALRALNLADWASELQDQWQTLLDHYSFMKAREVMHTELTDSILGRVVRWTIFEAVTLILIATGQILYLRKFMETKRYL